MSDATRRIRLPFSPADPTRGALWTVAVLLFGIGDLATTIYFIDIGIAVEANPIGASIIDYGYEWLVVWKLLVLALFYGVYRVVPRRVDVGVPVGLLLVGGLITFWNTYSSVTRTPLFF